MGPQHRACLFLGSRFQPPAGQQNYSNKPIPSSRGNQGSPLPLVTTKPALTASASLLSSQVHLLCGLVCHVTSPSLELWVQVTNNCCQSHLSCVKCHVFSHPHNPRAWLSPLPTEWRRGNRNRLSQTLPCDVMSRHMCTCWYVIHQLPGSPPTRCWTSTPRPNHKHGRYLLLPGAYHPKSWQMGNPQGHCNLLSRTWQTKDRWEGHSCQVTHQQQPGTTSPGWRQPPPCPAPR